MTQGGIMKILKQIALICLVGLMASLLIAGCSDNKKSTKQLTQGDPNDAGYQGAKGIVEGQIDYVLSGLTNGMGFFGGFNPRPHTAGTADTSYFGYNPTSGWYYYYSDMSESLYTYWWSDSARYSNNGTAQENPDSTTDKMEFIFYYGLTAEDTTYNIEFEYQNDWDFTGLDTDTTEINGDGGYSYNYGYGGQHYGFDYTDSYAAVKAVVDGAHPFAGAVEANMTGDFVTEQGLAHATWSIKITFYEDYYHAYVSDGSSYWVWDTPWPA